MIFRGSDRLRPLARLPRLKSSFEPSGTDDNDSHRLFACFGAGSMTVDGDRRLRGERAARGMSQRQLASAAGVSVRTIRSLESGRIVKPRLDTIERLVLALALGGEDRRSFLRSWGISKERRVVDPAEMIYDPRLRKSILASARRQMDLITTMYSQGAVTIDADRRIIDEKHECVVRAEAPGVQGTAAVFVADSAQARAAMTVYPRVGCTLTRETVLADGLTSVFEWDFGRELDRGDTHLYRYERKFGPFTPTSSDPSVTGSTDHWLGRCNLEGTHRGAELLIVETVFDPADPPRRCVRLLERQLGGGYEELGPVEVVGGRAQLVIVEPVAGWHGLGWEW